MVVTCFIYLSFKDFECQESITRMFYSQDWENISKIRGGLSKQYAFLLFAAEHWPTLLHAANPGSLNEDVWQAFRNMSQSSTRLGFLLSLDRDFRDTIVRNGIAGEKVGPLQVAMYFGFEEIVQRLLGTLDSDFYLDNKDNGCGALHDACEALMIAARQGRRFIVRLLVDFGANTNYKRPCADPIQRKVYYHNYRSTLAHTPLQAAATMGHEDVI
jgi:hypothetical protein